MLDYHRRRHDKLTPAPSYARRAASIASHDMMLVLLSFIGGRNHEGLPPSRRERRPGIYVGFSGEAVHYYHDADISADEMLMLAFL